MMSHSPTKSSPGSKRIKKTKHHNGILRRAASNTPPTRALSERNAKIRKIVSKASRGARHQGSWQRQFECEDKHTPIYVQRFSSEEYLPLEVHQPTMDAEQSDLEMQQYCTDNTDNALLTMPFDNLLSYFEEEDEEQAFETASPDSEHDIESLAWGNVRVAKTTNRMDYSIVESGDPAIRIFRGDEDKIDKWLQSASQYAYTLLKYRGVPHIVVITTHHVNLADFPSSIPARIVATAIEPFVIDYDNDPLYPFSSSVIVPGSSIGVQAAGTFGGVVRVSNERRELEDRYALTAGHALRKSVKEGEKLVKKELDMKHMVFHPAKKDVQHNRSIKSAVEVEGALASAKAKAEMMLKYAERAAKFAERNPEDVSAQKQSQDSKEEALKLRSIFQHLFARKQNLREDAVEIGCTKISIVKTRKIDDGGMCTEDWGLVKLGAQAKASNELTLFCQTLRLHEIEDIEPGMLVVKKGRSTGTTIGKVNEVSLKVKMEFCDIFTSEWTVVPATDEDLSEDLKSSELVEEDGRPILRDIFGYIGDSGSLVINWASKKVVGMIIGGAPSKKVPVTYITPISVVMEWLKDELGVDTAELE